MLFTLVISAFVLLCIWDYVIKRHRVTTFAKYNIKGPIALPVLGCAIDGIHISNETIVPFIGDGFQKYGKTFRMWVFNEAQIYTMNVKHFEAILTSTTLLEKGDLYDLLRPWLNDGLLLSTGKKWHARRKVFTPAFHFKVLEHYVEVFDRQSGVMVKQLEELADGNTVIDMFDHVALAALDVITETAMGVRVNAQLNSDFPYLKALKSVVYLQPNRMVKPDQRTDWLFKLTAPRLYRKVMRDIKTMHDFTTEVIEQRRDALQRSIADGTYQPLSIGDDDIGRRQQMAFLDILLRSTIDGKPLSNEDIREEVDTFMFEGDDTTTSGTSHALYCISRHPEIQKKLFEEIKEVMGTDKEQLITMKQLQQLKYMECVIKETMRLYPPVPAIGRKVKQDLKIGGIILPANSSIYLVTYFAHRDPENFPDPEMFKPERFSDDLPDDGATKRDPFIYTPFSAGPKNCIGQKFAILEMKALISKMLRYYELLPFGPKIVPMMNFILRCPHGVNIGLKPREY